MSVPKGSKKKDNKIDPARFEGDGISFKGKFIGVADVWDSHGDEMCQETMQKLKAAVKSSGEHKLRILLNISLEGIKIIDEKTEAVNYTHMVNHISFVSKDASDSRAIGYVYGPGDGTHKFFAIKTEKSAEQVMFTVRDLFEVKKKELEEAAAKEAAKSETEDSKDSASAESEKTKEKAEDDHVYSVPPNNKPVEKMATKNLLDLETDLITIQQGMDSIGNALAKSGASSPFPAVAAQDNANPWNTHNQSGSTSQTPSPLLQPPPPVVRSHSLGIGIPPRGHLSLPVVGQQSSAGSVSPQMAAAAFPMPVSSAFPPVASPGAAMPPGMFPVTPAAAAAAAASPPFVSAVVGNQIIMQSSPKLPAASPHCALPIVTDPFGDNLFSSSSSSQASILTSPRPVSQPFLIQPAMQSTFAGFSPRPGTPPVFYSGSPSGSLLGNSLGSSPSNLLGTSFGSSPSKFDAFSADNTFSSLSPSGFNSNSLQQESSFNPATVQEQVVPNPGTQTPPTAAINSSPGAAAPEELPVAPPATAGTRMSQNPNLFDDLCSFGSKQPHKKPAELFPRLEPPIKKLNELLEEKEKEKDQQNLVVTSPTAVGSPSPLPSDVFSPTPFQASDASIPSAGPSDDLLCDPKKLPEPSGSPLLPTDPAFWPEKSGQHSSRSSGIFSFSGNHSTEVTYAVATPEPSEIEFNHPAPSHPPPPLPPSVATTTNPDFESSPCSSSSAHDLKTILSDDDEDFNLPAPVVPPPPLPSETVLNLVSQAPAPPPRPRLSEISKFSKPPPPRPRRNLSSSSSLQSMDKSNSPVPSTISQDGMTQAADSGLAGSSFFSPSSPASDISNLSHFSAWADTTKFDNVFQASSISPGLTIDNNITNNNNSPQLWSTFNENENSYSPSSNRSLSSGRDFFPTTPIVTRASSINSWPDNNPFVVTTIENSSLTNTSSLAKDSTVDFSNAFPALSTKSDPFVPTSCKAASDFSESPTVDPFSTTSSNPSSRSTSVPVDNPFVVPGPIKQKTNDAKNDPFAMPSLAKLRSSSVPPDNPFIIPSQTKLQLDDSQPDPFVLPSVNRAKSEENQAADPFVISSHTQLQTNDTQTDPFVLPSVNRAKSEENQAADPFVISSHTQLQTNDTQTDPFITPTQSNEINQTQSDPFVVPTQTKHEIDQDEPDPFVSPSSIILPPNGTRTDPFEGFSQWSTPSSVNAVNTANGCRKFSWETSFETEPIYAVVNKK